ncbi:MAG: HAD family hydrolase [Bythopirellula sp.]|nr:HAD family hydrolase [Bythopirellula sp.]
MIVRLTNQVFSVLVLLALCANSALAQTADPLPSWNDGPAKKAILDFVDRVTYESDDDGYYVPPAKRIAVFDNDGTLWCEQPMYVQAAFALDRVKALAAEHPEWKDKEPFKSVLAGDLQGALAGGEQGLVEIVAATHTGMSTAEFEQIVKDWIAKAEHPRFKRPYTECFYQPMLEVLAYLRENDFKTFIVSGGGIEFMRPWTEQVYGIPPQQVVGSSVKTKYEVVEGRPVLMRLPEINFIDDKTGKPIGINSHIGQQPILAFGNSDGDYEMLEWTTSGEPDEGHPRLGLLVHHTDAVREYAYDNPSHVGQLKRGLDDAKARGWILIDMKNDWKTIFPAEPSEVTAIDILLEPDATMIEHAEAVNARLLKSYPQGYSLDATHRPHVTCLQRYVNTADLDKVYAAVDKVLAEERPTNWQLEAYKYYYLPTQDNGLAGIVVKPTPDILRFQQKLIEAVAPYTVKTGTAAAYVTTKEDPGIVPMVINYVADYVPKYSGKNFNPHVTVGVAKQDFLNTMLKEPFDSFTFSPVGVAVYHLGNYGTARKKLKAWDLKK